MPTLTRAQYYVSLSLLRGWAPCGEDSEDSEDSVARGVDVRHLIPTWHLDNHWDTGDTAPHAHFTTSLFVTIMRWVILRVPQCHKAAWQMGSNGTGAGLWPWRFRTDHWEAWILSPVSALVACLQVVQCIVPGPIRLAPGGYMTQTARLVSRQNSDTFSRKILLWGWLNILNIHKISKCNLRRKSPEDIL